MPVRHRFVYTWPPGTTPITFDQWARLLPEQEKDEFLKAKERQIAYRTDAIKQGYMTIDQGTYVWKDQHLAKQNKPTDEIWYRYFERYLKETNTIFQTQEEQC